MDSRLFIILLGISIFLAACSCREDEFGDQLELIVPIKTSPTVDTLSVGDTLTIEAEFPKDVAVAGSDNKLLLDGFNFFTEISISEISGTDENYDLDIDIIEEIGRVEILNLATALTYPILFQEDDDAYRFKAKFVFRSPGLIYLFFYSSPILFEQYDHPALYSCKDRKRSRVEVHYQNNSTKQAAYDNLFLSTNVSYLPEVFPFEEYKIGGSHTFVVK